MRCINHEELLRPLLLRITQDEAQLAAMATSSQHPQCQKILKRYYRSFYVRPSTRSLYEYRFANVSAELLEKLLEYAVPLDEKAMKQMDDAANELALANKKLEQEKLDELMQRLPVTFKIFERNIMNLEEIVQSMKGCEEYKDKSEDECALEYYIAFYTKPQIREKFAYEFKPCPGKLRDKLLQLPAGSSATELLQSGVIESEQNELALRHSEVKESQPKEQSETMPETLDIDCNANQTNALVQSERILITLRGNTYEFPVSVQTFKRYINYDTVRIELANSYSKNKQKVEKILNDERYDLILLRRFYHSFYIDPRARQLCNYNFNAAPAELQQKLNQFAVQCSPEPTQQTPATSSDTVSACAEDHTRNSNDVHTSDSSGATSVSPVAEPNVEQQALVEAQPNTDIKYPVSFNIFSNILNLDEIVRQMQEEPQYAKATVHDCMLAYYDAFYRTPEVRDKYKCNFKSCPALLKAKLLQLPANPPTSECSQPTERSESIEDSAVLYAARKTELER